MRVGIDFDNTLAGYDLLFTRIAREWGLLPQDFQGRKKEVRDAVRLLDGGEAQWMRLQAEAYGPRMAEAVLIEGAASFLLACRDRAVEVFIVSHKTPYAAAAPDGTHLHGAALEWMEARGFFAPDGFALARDRVFFEPTREAKCRRIAALGCSHFIDDLEEVFRDPAFPEGVGRLLLCGTEFPLPMRGTEFPLPKGPFSPHSGWASVARAVFAE